MNIYRIKKINQGLRSGQAVVELAVFGTLIIIVLSTLIMYGQRFEMQQQLKVEAFRKALRKAFDRNSSVTYTLKKDVRFYNLMGNLGQGQPSTMGGSAMVMWQKGMPGKQDSKDQPSFAYYQINDEMIGVESGSDNHCGDDNEKCLPRYEKVVKGYDGNKIEVKAPASVWKEDRLREETYKSTVKKDEKKSSGWVIINKVDSELSDKAQSKVYTRFDASESDPNKPIDDPSTLPDYTHYENVYDTAEHNAYITDDNRISYTQDPSKQENKIIRSREWSTGVK
ncbi:hypothetical protein D4R78_03040 [bacterium]|nr:MAG: hypothetical protein D4R78_03040 [bacterium]